MKDTLVSLEIQMSSKYEAIKQVGWLVEVNFGIICVIDFRGMDCQNMNAVIFWMIEV